MKTIKIFDLAYIKNSSKIHFYINNDKDNIYHIQNTLSYDGDIDGFEIENINDNSSKNILSNIDITII